MSDNTLFEFYKLNKKGQKSAVNIADAFRDLVDALEKRGCMRYSREFSIVKTKLEEACFFATKSMAINPAMQETI